MMAEMLLIAGKKGRTMFQSLRGGYTHVTYSSIVYLYYEVIIARNDFFLQIPGIKTHPCQPTVWCGWVHPPTSRPQVLVLECEPRRRLLKKITPSLRLGAASCRRNLRSTSARAMKTAGCYVTSGPRSASKRGRSRSPPSRRDEDIQRIATAPK